MKWKKRETSVKRSGASTSKVRKYIYCEQLKFLEKVPVHRPTISNLDTSTDNGHPGSSESQELTPAVQPGADHVTRNQRLQAKNSTPVRKRKRGLDEFEMQILKAVQPEEPEDRNMSFFKGILPSLQDFNETQTIDFQITVLQLIKNIQNGQPMWPLQPQPQQQLFYAPPAASCNSQQPYVHPYPPYPQQYPPVPNIQFPTTSTCTSTSNQQPIPTPSASSNTAHHAAVSRVIDNDTASIISVGSQSVSSEEVASPVFSQYMDIEF